MNSEATVAKSQCPQSKSRAHEQRVNPGTWEPLHIPLRKAERRNREISLQAAETRMRFQAERKQHVTMVPKRDAVSDSVREDVRES